MKEVFTIEKEFVFNNNIYEITSISIEHNYDVAGSICQGIHNIRRLSPS